MMNFVSVSAIRSTTPVGVIMAIDRGNHQWHDEPIPVVPSVRRQVREVVWIIQHQTSYPTRSTRRIEAVHRVLKLSLERELIRIFDNLVHWLVPAMKAFTVRPIDLTATKKILHTAKGVRVNV